MSQYTKYASVILDVAIEKTLDYGVKPEHIDSVQRGMRVEVPLRGQLRQGYVFDVTEKASFSYKVRPIHRILSDNELITRDVFELAIWMAKYYCAPLRRVLKTIVPSSVRKDMQHKEQQSVERKQTREKLKEACIALRAKFPAQAAVLDVMLKVKGSILLTELLEQAGVTKSPVSTLEKKGLLKLGLIRIDRSPLINAEYFRTKPKKLNDEQAQALAKIAKSIEEKRFESHLLFGITGSGKTEVYLQAIEKALSLGLGTIMLVPEVALTAQTIERFKSRFEEYVAVLHHRLSAGERYDEWHKIRSGEAKIVIGARSALFSPLPNLGLIIVDEEHEGSYKQTDEAPCYHARDVAVMRGHLSKSAVVLGSATPSLESYQNAMCGKYTLSCLTKRPTSAQLPTVTILDMKKEYERAKGYTTFSDALLNGIKKRIELGEQSLLFLNRRGYHASQMCLSCQNPVKCKHCDLALTFHYNDNTLSCHLCGFLLSPPPRKCPTCHSENNMKFRGVGTEQVQRALHAILPNVRTVRMDADTTRHKGSHDRLIREFRTGKADVLIGTQMIAKGLHFAQVTLVGVLNSDASLNIPDFRSSERVFQLLTQVAGRSGRGCVAGEVIIQSCMPENSTIKLASRQDYLGFYEEEVVARRMFGFPPFSHIIKFTFSGPSEKGTLCYTEQFYRALMQRMPSSFKLSPPLPAGYAKIKDRFRFQFTAQGESVYFMNEKIAEVKELLSVPKNLRVSVDVDPLSTFF